MGKVRDMIRRMDQVVEDYVILFSHLSDECAILPGVYQKIRKKDEKSNRYGSGSLDSEYNKRFCRAVAS